MAKRRKTARVAVKRVRAPAQIADRSRLATEVDIPATDSGGLTMGDVMNLMSQAARHGVKALRFRDLTLSFDHSHASSSVPSGASPQTSGLNSDSGRPTTRGKGSSTLLESSDAIDRELENLKLMDPLAYEEHVLGEDADDGDGD